MNNCAISRWDDPNEINAKLKALTSQPIGRSPTSITRTSS